MNLIYVNELGPNYKGDNIYEFIFSDIDDVWGEDWDATPSGGKPLPPQIEFIKKVDYFFIASNHNLFFLYIKSKG